MKSDLSDALKNLGDLFVAKEETDQAQRCFEECLTIRKKLEAQDASSAVYKVAVCEALKKLAELHTQRQREYASDMMVRLKPLVQQGLSVEGMEELVEIVYSDGNWLTVAVSELV